jgi:hypothetical protein
MVLYSDGIRWGVIEDARGRENRQRRHVLAAFATAAVVALVAFALLSGGGPSRYGAAAPRNVSGSVRPGATPSIRAMTLAALRDCARNDPLRGHYTLPVLRAALTDVKSASLRYSTCPDALSIAIRNSR